MTLLDIESNKVNKNHFGDISLMVQIGADVYQQILAHFCHLMALCAAKYPRFYPFIVKNGYLNKNFRTQFELESYGANAKSCKNQQ